MPRVGSSRWDKSGSDSVLPESRIVNEEGAEKPSVALFQHFFVLRAAGKKRGSSDVDIAGCCNFQLRDGLGELYIPQGLVERPRRWNPGTIQIPGVDEGAGSEQQTGVRDAAGSRQQAGGKDAAGGGAAAQGDKGKRPRSYVPQPSSSSSPSPPRQQPADGGAMESGRGGQSSGAESRTEARSRARELEDQGPAGGAIAGARTDPPPKAGSKAAPQQPEGQSPPPKPQGLGFKIPESRWLYRGPKYMPPKDPAGGQRKLEGPRSAPAPRPSAPAPGPSAPAGPEPRAPTSPGPRAEAAPEQPAPIEPAPSILRAERVATVEVVAARAAPVRQPSGTLSASTERAHRGPSPRPPSSQAPEPLPEVLGSAWEVIERLKVAVAAERAELDKERVALVEERGRLEEVGKLLEACIVSARATYEKSMRVVAEEREALEETRDEAVAAQEKASRMERQRPSASRHPGESVGKEKQVQDDKFKAHFNEQLYNNLATDYSQNVPQNDQVNVLQKEDNPRNIYDMLVEFNSQDMFGDLS
ncbi:uncharacterized protein LOC133898515 [Phragmites australis]|uniref:uncharacterized protein LOC133898515 n=1 Tax=Phragmites australis TaxID=29695 RepID=UPI002D7805E1|nr:uncharacterized protein LOC133898515 [Phragmites australis]